MKQSRVALTTVLILLLAVILFVLTACSKKDSTTEPGPEYGIVAGTVYAQGRAVLPDATVSIGTKTTQTDSNGNFILFDIPAGAGVKVDFAKTGYISNQKIVVVSYGKTVHTSSTLLVPRTQTFSATAENLLYDFNVSNTIGIPADAFMDGSGNTFTGTVLSEMRFFDPTDPDNLSAFPGTFSGVRIDGTETMFESYGFLNASFYDANNPNTELKLRTGKQAAIRYAIPAALQASAPATIPLWYYDSELGKWKEEGSATRNGDYYEGMVSHFSYWNFDHPVTVTDQATITGKVVLADDNTTPVYGAQVVATGVSYAGYTTTYTNSSGEFSISVKGGGASVKLQAFSGINSSPFTQNITTPAAGGTADIGNIAIANMNFTITGKLLDSSGNPIRNSYGGLNRINPPAGSLNFSVWMNTDSTGTFTATYLYPEPGAVFNVQFSLYIRGNLYSPQISFRVPQAGGVYNFGNVTMQQGGIITGRLRHTNGTYMSGGWVSFFQQGATGEGSHVGGQVDENGNFSLQGPPSTNLTNMVGGYYYDSQNLITNPITLNFPASGSTRDIGIVTLYPAPE